LVRRESESDKGIINWMLLHASRRSVLLACPQTPFLLNERLRIQMGSFMVPGDISTSFEDNLRALPDHDQAHNVLKIVIPMSQRAVALRELFDMCISRRTLFPGLDGYAQTLAVYSPAFNPIKWRP
jgi:hypothetical protein